MLALVDHSRVRSPVYPPPLRPGHPPATGDSSPTTSTSPCQSRRPPRSPLHTVASGIGHPVRSQSETMPSAMPVDLNAESSSVTTLLMTNRLNSSGTKGQLFVFIEKMDGPSKGLRGSHACVGRLEMGGRLTLRFFFQGLLPQPIREQVSNRWSLRRIYLTLSRAIARILVTRVELRPVARFLNRHHRRIKDARIRL